MRTFRIALTGLVVVASLAGTVALLQSPVLADAPDFCPTRPLPPALDSVCRACPDVVRTVVCPVICAGGVKEKSFTNQCYANCSGYIFAGPCVETGG